MWTGAGSSSTIKRTQQCGIIRRYDPRRRRVISKSPARYFYEEKNGSLRKGIEVFHICAQSLCINLDHLIAGERSTLYKWAHEAGRIYRPTPKTHCVNGHALSGENLYIWESRDGHKRRMCRECRNKRGREILRKKHGWKPRQKREHPSLYNKTVKATSFRVAPFFGGWSVDKEGEVLSTHRLKADAEKVGRIAAKEGQPSKLEFTNRAGELLYRYTYGIPQTQCPRGHAFTESNTLVYYNVTEERWNRQCRKCTNKRLRVKWRKEHGKGNMIAKYREEWVESYGI